MNYYEILGGARALRSAFGIGAEGALEKFLDVFPEVRISEEDMLTIVNKLKGEAY